MTLTNEIRRYNNVQEEDNNTTRSTKQLRNYEKYFDAETMLPFKYLDMGSALSKLRILTPVLPIRANTKPLGVCKYVLQ